MRVFARVDRRCRPAFAEKYGSRLGPKGYTPLALSAQNVYVAEDVEKMLEPHVRCDGNIDTVFLEFEDEQIPVSHQGELCLVAAGNGVPQLAGAPESRDEARRPGPRRARGRELRGAVRHRDCRRRVDGLP
jgi:hypothetical protein